MSWDKFETEKKCYCGKGKIIEIYKIDDWNRSETEYKILCPICKKEKEESDRIETEKYNTYIKQNNEIKELFNTKYLSLLMEKFDDCKSKKEFYERLKDFKLESRSISSFYSDNKQTDRIDILKKYIDISNMNKIIKILVIDDEEFLSLVNEAYTVYIERWNRSIRYYHKGY